MRGSVTLTAHLCTYDIGYFGCLKCWFQVEFLLHGVSDNMKLLGRGVRKSVGNCHNIQGGAKKGQKDLIDSKYCIIVS